VVKRKKEKKHRNEEYYEDEFSLVIKRQNAARQTMIKRYNRINKEAYDEKRNAAYRIF